MANKITDKMRLDYLGQHHSMPRKIFMSDDFLKGLRWELWYNTDKETYGWAKGKTLRDAIDAAIRAAKSKKKGGG